MVFWKKNSFTSSFLGKKMKKKKFLKINGFLSKMFSQIKMQALQTGLGTLKNIKHLIFLNDRFLMQFSKITFFRAF